MMKKLIQIFIPFLLTGSILLGQSSPIIVVSTSGKVNYMNGSNPSKRISAGAVVSPEGTIVLGEKATTLLFCNGAYKKLKQGKNSLTELCGGSTTTRSLNIDSKIADFMIASVQLAHNAAGHNSGWVRVTDSENAAGDGWGEGGKDGWGEGGKDGWGEGGKDGWGEGGKDGWGEGGKDGWGEGGKDGWGEGGKDGWGEGGKDGWGEGGKDGWGEGGKDGWGEGGKDGWGEGGKDGWGGMGKRIYLILPMGRLENGMAHFWWSKPSATTSYKLEILDPSKKVIHSLVVKDTFADINLKKLALKQEEQYTWRISSVDDPKIISKMYRFAIEDLEAKESSLSKLSKSKIYKNADQTTRSLMEAVILEDEDWYYEASKIYKNLKKKNPNNNLVNMMHAAFWMRAGLPVLADAAVMP